MTGCWLADTLDQAEGESGIGRSVEVTVRSNERLLEQLLCQVSHLTNLLSSTGDSMLASPTAASNSAVVRPHVLDEIDQHQACEDERILLESQIADLESRLAQADLQLCDLRQQNRDLAAKVAGTSVRNAISDTGAAETMSWEQRKQLMIQQMEQESFDAESFVANMPYQSDEERETPEQFVERLIQELEMRNQEIQELHRLLQEQAEIRDRQLAIGAAAIAHEIDSNELVQQERDRLRGLQAQWEAKFREEEIEASLERAKLSRERQELAKRQAELEEELEHLRREQQQPVGSTATSSRRWLVKLGLSDQS